MSSVTSDLLIGNLDEFYSVLRDLLGSPGLLDESKRAEQEGIASEGRGREIVDEETTMSDGIGNEPMPEERGTASGAGATPQEPGWAGATPDAAGSRGEGRASHGAPWWHEPHASPGQWAGYGDQGHGAPGGYDPRGYGNQGHGGYGPGQHWQHAQGAGGAWGWAGSGGWSGPPSGGGPRAAASGPRRALAAGAAGLVALAAVAVGIGIGYDVWSANTAPSADVTPHATSGITGRTVPTGVTPATSSGKTTAATGSPSNLSAIAKKVTPGLVDVNTVLGYAREEAAGTGMVLTPTGKVLTNNHVIEGSTSISVTDLGNGKTYSASVVGYDKTQDVAVIQLKGASGLTTVKTGNSANVRVGEPVVGIGNAGGTGGAPSVAGGSVTALNQAITASDQGTLGTTVEHLTGLIESDCDIQPGDSGGPLVNTTGVVLGMDTAASAAQGFSFSGASTGQGYSIPINTATSIAKQIIAGKASAVVHIGGTGFLGVYVSTASSRGANGFGGLGSRGLTATPATFTSSTTAPATTAKGAYVTAVIGGTPAQAAGLAKGDVITAVGGTAVTSASAVTKIMMQYHPGDKVRVAWTAPTGAPHAATVTLGSGPAD